MLVHYINLIYDDFYETYKFRALVDFEYDKTFLKSMVSDFFHFRLSVFAVGKSQFREEIFLKIHHKVAGGAQSSEELKSVLQASAYVRL